MKSFNILFSYENNVLLNFQICITIPLRFVYAKKTPASVRIIYCELKEQRKERQTLDLMQI